MPSLACKKVCKLFLRGACICGGGCKGTAMGHGCGQHAVRKKQASEYCRVHSRGSGLQGHYMPSLAKALCDAIAGILEVSTPAGMGEGMGVRACRGTVLGPWLNTARLSARGRQLGG